MGHASPIREIDKGEIAIMNKVPYSFTFLFFCGCAGRPCRRALFVDEGLLFAQVPLHITAVPVWRYILITPAWVSLLDSLSGSTIPRQINIATWYEA